ncbi:cytochrome P450 [Actinomadura rupiterrae]|uniref:cytochrome P450 n=1 Tax=Actinomadura rupiterrae TaxID=559627 RepID=UPI0020A51090|nr:cytochrome P450 [Actinomadura rupiterrae]MCP2343107.1 pulcherriminic acid synthase [Actinomadura rupiterrae]
MATDTVTGFRIPEISLPFPGPVRRGDAERLRAGVCGWAEERGLVGPRGRARLETSRLLDLGIALTGRADPDRAAVLMGWFLWVLLLDDRVDDGPWAAGGVLAEFSASALAVLRADANTGTNAEANGEANGETGAGALDDPMLVVLAEDLWPRTSALAGPAWQERFAGHLARHLTAQCSLVERRASGRLPRLPGYVGLRRDLFGADVFFDLFEAVDGIAPPDDAVTAGLRAAAADVIAWTNDLFSVEKDLAFGERANLVLLLRERHVGTLQEAVDAARTLISARAADFQILRRGLPRGARDAGRLADRLRRAMRASLDWHRSVPRYRPRAAAAVAASGSVAGGSGGPSGAGGGCTGRGSEEVDPALTPPSLLWPEFERDPYPLYRRLREEFPVVRDEPMDAWLVSRYTDVRAALSDPRFNSHNYGWQLAPMFGRTVLQMDGREHAAHRSFLTPAFRGRALTWLRAAIERTAADLVADLASKARRGDGVVDLVDGFCHRLPIAVVVTALGLPVGDAPLFQDWYQAGFSYLSNYRQDPALLERGLSSRDELYAYLAPYVARRRIAPGRDLLSVLCTAEVEGEPLPDEMVMGFCGMLLGAGGETTDKGMRSLLANLLDHPDALAGLRAAPDGLAAAWVETLRRDPPVQVVLRQTEEAVDLPSGRVPGGATVACLVGAAGRDPEQFADPDRFDPSRLADEPDRQFTAAAGHLSFGAGRHFCLGSQLARAEAEIGVRTLLAALPRLRWADGFRPQYGGLLTRAPEELLVTFR